MTFSSRRKRPTTRRARSTPSRTACSSWPRPSCSALAGSAGGRARGRDRARQFVPRKDGPPAGLATGRCRNGPADDAANSHGRRADPPARPSRARRPISEPQDQAGPFPASPAAGARRSRRRSRPAAAGTAPARPDPYEAYIRLEPPGRERLFGSRDTERELEERMRQERQGPRRAAIPISLPGEAGADDRAVPGAAVRADRRAWPSRATSSTAGCTSRRRTRSATGGTWGRSSRSSRPCTSSRTSLCLPHNFASYPCRRFDTNAGQCLPGDPVPYLCYPPEMTWSGCSPKRGVIGLLFWAIP